MTIGKFKLLAVAVLMIGLISTGVTLSLFGAPPEVKAIQQAAPQQKPAEPAKDTTDKDNGPIDVTGQVLSADGKPVAGAELAVWTDKTQKKEDVVVRATTGDDGRFRLTVARADLERKAKLVATAKGHAPDWLNLPAADKAVDVTLHLAKDDVPIDGRVLNLEGRPLAGVTVRVVLLEKRTEDGDLGPWVEMWKKRLNREKAADVPLTRIRPEAVGVATTATTDKDGSFRLNGFGRERLVSLDVRGPDIEHRTLYVVTRADVDSGLAGWGIYGATFKHLAVPGKPIVGTVRDKRTGKPIAGMTVTCSGARATTDDKGRYRLDGVGKHADYWVDAGSVPYFRVIKTNVKDTAGLEPLTVDFELEQGLVMRGRLTDKATGKPIRASMSYDPLVSNPNLKDFTEGHAQPYGAGEVAADGSFCMVTVPGPGLLGIKANEAGRYCRTDADDDETLLVDVIRVHRHPRMFHTVVRIDPSAKEPKSTTCDLVLEPGTTRTGTVVGPEDKPLTGVLIAGDAPVLGTSDQPQKLETAAFTVTGLNKQVPRSVLFYHPEKRLSKLVQVKADDGAPLTVRLEPAGTMTGRVVDAEGRPLAGLSVLLDFNRSVLVNKHIPFEYLTATTPLPMQTAAKTDDEGRFRLEGVIPGLRYNLFVSEGGLGTKSVVHRKGVSVESDKNKDLGDLKPMPEK